MREANEVISGWMHEASMSTRRDDIGNLIGRRISSSTALSTEQQQNP